MLTRDRGGRRNGDRLPLAWEKNNLSGKSHVNTLARGWWFSCLLMVKLCSCIKYPVFEIKNNVFASLRNIFMQSTSITWWPRHVGSRRGCLSYFTPHRPSGGLINAAGWILPPAEFSHNCPDSLRGSKDQSVRTCSCSVGTRRWVVAVWVCGYCQCLLRRIPLHLGETTECLWLQPLWLRPTTVLLIYCCFIWLCHCVQPWSWSGSLQ